MCKNNNCDANASCHNNDGTYSCSCNNGFTGDGFNCTGILFFITKSLFLLLSLLLFVY